MVRVVRFRTVILVLIRVYPEYPARWLFTWTVRPVLRWATKARANPVPVNVGVIPLLYLFV